MIKEEKRQKWKKYVKVLISIFILLLLAGYKLSTMKVQNVPETLDVHDDRIEDAFKQAVAQKNMLTVTGQNSNVRYEWFYPENMVTDTKQSDLSVEFTDEFDQFVQKKTNAIKIQGYYFKDNIILNGKPQLTLKLKNWKSEDVKLYRIWNNKLQYILDPIVNIEEGVSEITYQVTQTKGIFYLVGDIHNNCLQFNKNIDETFSDKPEKSEKVTPSEKNKIEIAQTSQQPEKKTNEETEKDSVDVTPSKSSNSDTDIENITDIKSSNSVEKVKYIQDIKPSGESERMISVCKAVRTISDGKQKEQDQYQTDPIPEGKPLPVEPDSIKTNFDKSFFCTISIDCKTLLQDGNKVISSKKDYVPNDGWIYNKKKVIFYEGESVFDVLLRETKKQKIQMEYVMTPAYNSIYIEGIQHLYEFDGGQESGWMYQVNGWYPNYGCSRYMLQEGDVIEWRYTCAYGQDLGCDWLGSKK